jgi:hypothetical protein
MKKTYDAKLHSKKVTGYDRLFGTGFFWMDKTMGGKRVLKR